MMKTEERDPAKALEILIRRETQMNRVNGITDEEKQAVYEYAGRQHGERSKHRWRVKIAAGIVQRFPSLRGIKL